uniref:Uncharacterized protein n=1 Tax=viral metagenome TaxID=1070528 RepID=A0A6H1ZQ98_9ZZZZ
MKLNELISAFKNKYWLECSLRKVTEIDFKAKHLALMLSEVFADIQKRLGVIEATTTETSVSGTAVYDLTSSFMTIKSVSYGNTPLDKVSTSWIKTINAETETVTGTPTKYAILYEDNVPQLYLYPTPASSGDDIIIQSESNFNLYSPTAVSNDFGTFNGTTFSGDTTIPTQYDLAIILGMMQQVFPDYNTLYEREMSMLRIKQYNGEKFEYKLG